MYFSYGSGVGQTQIGDHDWNPDCASINGYLMDLLRNVVNRKYLLNVLYTFTLLSLTELFDILYVPSVNGLLYVSFESHF